MDRRLLPLALACVWALAGASVSGAQTTHELGLRVLSSPATMVTGGDALVQVSVPRTVPTHQATVLVNGRT